MSARSVDDRVDDYVDRLAPNDRNEFNRRYEEELTDRDFEEIREELVGEYQSDERHLDLVTAAASAFDQDPAAGGHESGYEFAFTEPLEEQNSLGEEGVSNGDVLLVKEDGIDVYLCIIECKSGTANESEWSGQLADIQDVIETDEYRETLKVQLGIPEGDIRHVQYVLLGYIGQVHGLQEDLLADGEDIPDAHAYWGYDQGDLSIVNMKGEVQVTSLARAVNSPIDAGMVENPIKFIFGDHVLTQLKEMVESLIDEKKKSEDEHPFEFNRSDFLELFDGFLQVGFEGDVRERLVNEKVDTLLEKGLQIGIFTDSNSNLNSRRDYRILFQGQKSQVAKQTTEEKYFDAMAEERRKERAFEAVQEEFSPEQTRWDEWD